MKQTAVEWLLEEMQKTYIFNQDDFDMFKKAKEMFEKQVRDAWNDGRYENTGCGDSEAYYDETFNK